MNKFFYEYNDIPTTVKMKAISLKQPWANLVIDGKKTLETRIWQTYYRGELVICSSSKPDLATVHPNEDRNPMGYALGTVELIDIVKMNINHEKDAMCKLYKGAYAWILKNPRKFKTPIKVKGQLNIFDIEIPFRKVKYG